MTWVESARMSTLLLHLALLPADVLLVYLAIRSAGTLRWTGFLGSLLAYSCLSFVGVVAAVQGWGAGLFAILQGACWAIFLHLPLCMLVFRKWWVAALSLMLAAIGIDAFLVEPTALEVSTLTIPGLPIRIALIADLQTDRIGAYEQGALQQAQDAHPDLFLFAGDYLQVPEEDFPEQSAALHAALMRLSAPLGGVAVKGDVDDARWAESFAGTAIQAVAESQTLRRGPVWVAALTPSDSRAPALGKADPVSAVGGYQIVLGHAPDIALASPPANLILAGHTHGGQVRIFGFPLLTLSKVPRDWAAGLTVLPGGGTLVVSRGIGMERRDAPRLRFFCRPQLVILTPG